MNYIVASMEGGITYAPDGTEFENMQILGFVEAENLIEARRKFLEENGHFLEHGYENKFNLKFYIAEDAYYPNGDTNFFEFSVEKNLMRFWGNSVGSLVCPLDEESKRILKEENFHEEETVEFSDELVRKLYLHTISNKLE